MKTPYAFRSHDEMKDVLRDASAPGPAAHYYMIRGGTKKSNVTIWEPGTVGGEYIKSYGHYHVSDFAEVYEILEGEGILILQGRAKGADGTPKDDEIESFRAIRVKAGDRIEIPKRAGHLMVNTGSTWLVTRDNSPFALDESDAAAYPTHADYSPFKRLRGAAYYVIERDGKPALVANPLYTKVPKAKIE